MGQEVQPGVFVVKRSPAGYSAGWRRQYQTKSAGGTREVITRFSKSSKRRLIRYVNNALAPYRYMATLTVRDWSLDGAEFKRRLDIYLRWYLAQMRGASDSPRESILWWLEFQARGAPHIHYLYTTRVPWERAANHWAVVIGQDIASTSTKFEKIRKPEAMAYYVGKYASKLEQKEVPPGYRSVGRFWGVRGYREVREAAMVATTEQDALRLQEAIATAANIELERGTVTVRGWEFGEGITIQKAKGISSLEKSGSIARMELVLAKAAADSQLMLYDILPGMDD